MLWALAACGVDGAGGESDLRYAAGPPGPDPAAHEDGAPADEEEEPPQAPQEPEAPDEPEEPECPECETPAVPTLDCFPPGWVDPDPSDGPMPGEGVCGDETVALAQAEAALATCVCRMNAADDHEHCAIAPACALDSNATTCCDELHEVAVATCELGNCMGSDECRGPGLGLVPANCNECEDDGSPGPLFNTCPCSEDSCTDGMLGCGGITGAQCGWQGLQCCDADDDHPTAYCCSCGDGVCNGDEDPLSCPGDCPP